MKTYTRVWTSEEYQAEIYDQCNARIDVRNDGQRARLSVDGTTWCNNTGGFACRKIYIDGRDEVKKLVKMLRQEQIWNLKNGIEKNCYVAMDRLASYISPQY